MKLLGIYSARKSTSQFESLVKDLKVLTGGEGTDWEKAIAMGAALDPENSLYASASSAAQAEAPADTSMTSTTILRPATVVLDQAPDLAAEAAPAPGAGLDFDLDIGTAEAGSDAAAAPAAEPESAGLDFDLDLGTPAAAPAAGSAPQAPAASADVVLDIDFDMPAMGSAPAVPDVPLAEVPATPAVSAADGGIDFNFDMGTSDSAAPPSLPEMSIETPAASGPAPLDLGGISLELEPPAFSGAATESAAADKPDNPEVATKLELAVAYAEMGDKDGARELFQEALAEGSPAQQEVARAKLDSLG